MPAVCRAPAELRQPSWVADVPLCGWPDALPRISKRPTGGLAPPRLAPSRRLANTSPLSSVRPYLYHGHTGCVQCVRNGQSLAIRRHLTTQGTSALSPRTLRSGGLTSDWAWFRSRAAKNDLRAQAGVSGCDENDLDCIERPRSGAKRSSWDATDRWPAAAGWVCIIPSHGCVRVLRARGLRH